jgi:protein-S-isoprenylcysteine O-methyltransferase Ste14
VSAIAGFAWGVHSLGEFDPFGTLALKADVHGTPPPPAAFVARGPYRYVRHPLYLSTLLLIWCAPHLSTDRLLFNVLWTAWIIIGTTLEERDLLAYFGEAYRRYQLRVPMLIPAPRLPGRHTKSKSESGG